MSQESQESQKRQDAVRALVNIVLLEGMLLSAVAAIYLYTNELKYLIGGVVASSLIFAPILLRWTRDHAPAMKAGRSDDRRAP